MSLSPFGKAAMMDPQDRERLLKGESRILEAIATGAPLRDTLTRIVELVESQHTEMMASIVLLDANGCIRLGAAPSLPESYLALIEGAPIGPETGSCGTAMFLRESVITSDIATDPRWKNYREGALRHGLCASWSSPILAADGTVLGALAQYYRKPCDPSPHDVHLIAVACRLAEIAIARNRDDERLRAHSRDLEEANQRLQEVSHLKDQFVKLVAHELRTPLTSIRGYAEFLSEGIGGQLSHTQEEFVAQIHLGADRLVSLVDDLLDYARLDAGTFKIFPRETNLGAKVREVLESFVPLAQAQEITLSASVPETPLVMTVDPQRLEQILTNLIGNAMKFTPPGGTVSVSAAATPEGARLEVRDTGPGIAADHLPRLFERFYQVSRGETGIRGTGLGLFISKVLVEAHGGRIGVESQPGKGSTFWFTLANVAEAPAAVLPDGE